MERPLAPLAETSVVTLLYTAHIAGEIALLPRLFTLISQERRVAAGPVILLDLGDTCAVEAWICRATQGRAPFLVMDSMGYDGVIIGGPEIVPIPPSSLRQLLGSILMSIIVWNRTLSITKCGITVTLAPGSAPLPESAEDQGPVICVDRSIDALPETGASMLTLGDVPQGHLARVDMAWPDWTVQSARISHIESDTLVNPTVAAVVELVENEARDYTQQGGDS